MGCGAYAQQRAVDDYGNPVRRITFNRENVSVVYATGDSVSNVQTVQVTRHADGDSLVGIITVEPIEADDETQLFDLNGRRVDATFQPGVYIEKRGTRVRRIVKIK